MLANNPALAAQIEAEQKAAQESAWARNRESVAPWIHANAMTAEQHPLYDSFKSWEQQAVPSLLQLGASLGDMQAQQMAAATNFAQVSGWPLRMTNEDGSFAVMVNVEGERPTYIGAFNVNAADTVGTDELWSNGSSGLDLNGEGTQVAVWDVGDPRLTHREFTTNTTRIIDLDGVSPDGVRDHATHVSGTLGAYGATNAAKGMANRAIILANDIQGDYSEMAAQFATNQFRLRIIRTELSTLDGTECSTIWAPTIPSGGAMVH